MAEKVLIVEDENIIALEIAWQLESMGYQIAGIISRGEDAVQQVEEKRPDLILMDIRLKGELDGFQTAKAILAKLAVPIVYLSALVDDKLKKSLAKEETDTYYLKKPFSEEELKATVSDILCKRVGSREKPASPPAFCY